MSSSQQDFVAQHYGSRARDYVASTVHSTGADLDQIEEIVRGRVDARVLDLGCGGGHVSYRAAPHVGQVVACDVTAAMLETVKATAAERGLANIAVQQAAAETLPFAEGSFDIVLCRLTMHHWADLEAGLRQARRVLKPGGPAVFIDTVAASDRVSDTYLQAIELLRDMSHVRNYSVAELLAGLSRAGFSVEGVTLRRMRMEFPSWIARTRTGVLHAEAIRSLQERAPQQVRDYYRIGEDGSFDLDAATFVLRAL